MWKREWERSFYLIPICHFPYSVLANVQILRFEFDDQMKETSVEEVEVEEKKNI